MRRIAAVNGFDSRKAAKGWSNRVVTWASSRVVIWS
jgi:hypothetical protein